MTRLLLLRREGTTRSLSETPRNAKAGRSLWPTLRSRPPRPAKRSGGAQGPGRGWSGREVVFGSSREVLRRPNGSNGARDRAIAGPSVLWDNGKRDDQVANKGSRVVRHRRNGSDAFLGAPMTSSGWPRSLGWLQKGRDRQRFPGSFDRNDSTRSPPSSNVNSATLRSVLRLRATGQ